MDETYQAYINRVARLTLPESYKTQIQNIQESPKFQDGKPVKFPGYSVVTPPWGDDPDNAIVYSSLEETQQQLAQKLPGLIIAVPPDSFHLTVADLIWNNDYRQAIQENPDFDLQLRQQIRESFAEYEPFNSRSPVCWQLLGLMIRPRSVAVCLVPKDENSYEQILQLRRSIYQNADLISLGIQQQYYFTAHVTLGYFGKIPTDLDQEKFCQILSSLSDRWLESEAQMLQIKQVELRKFDDMMRYYRQANWPVLSFA